MPAMPKMGRYPPSTLTPMSSPTSSPERVPVKTIATAIAMVVATYLLCAFFQKVTQILVLVAVAVFFALALNPAVDFLERRFHIRRGFAASVVFLVGAVLLIALLYLFITPLVHQTQTLIDRFPQMVDDTRSGKGATGKFVQQHHLDRWVAQNQDRFRSSITSSTSSLLTIASTVASTIAGMVTVLVLTFFMLLEGPHMVRAPLVFFEPAKQERIRRVAADAAKTVNGYVTGNLLISVIAGTVAYIALRATGVQFAFVLGVWVAFADLIPLIGATLGAIAAVGVAFLHSTQAGVINLIVYVVYQQVENHVLQTTIMARTVKLNPLVVLVSVLLGAAFAGFIGALFAIPIAGVVQVIGRDWIEMHRSELKGTDTAELGGSQE